MHRTIFLFLACAVWLLSCDSDNLAGTNNETQTKGTFFKPNGEPAANARVRVFATNKAETDSSSPLVTEDYVDAMGNAGLKLTAGHYSLVVDSGELACFVDSIFSNGDKIWIPVDTLRPMGTLVGRVRVQPMHSPSIAWVHLMRTDLFANVDSSGMFRFTGVPAGSYDLTAITRHEGYAPTHKQVQSVSDSSVDIGEIDLDYIGLPLVTGVQAVYDSLSGVVDLKWNEVQTSYAVYRMFGPPSGDVPPALADVESAHYSDTIFHPSNKTSSVYDSIETDVTYWIAAKTSAQTGPLWNKIHLHLKSPALAKQWNVDWDFVPFPSLGQFWEIDTTTDGLAAIGWHPTANVAPIVNLTLLRTDGTWAPPVHQDMDVFQDERAAWTFWKGRLWTIKGLSISGQFDDSTNWLDSNGLQLIRHTRIFDTLLLRSSTDGRIWDSLRLPVDQDSVTHLAFRPTANELNIIFKYDRYHNMSGKYPIAFRGRIRSSEGRTWEIGDADYWATRNCSASSGYSDLAFSNIAAPNGRNWTLAKFAPLGVIPPTWLLPDLETDTSKALLRMPFDFAATSDGKNLFAFLSHGYLWIATINRIDLWQRVSLPSPANSITFWRGKLVVLSNDGLHFATITPNQ